MGKPSADYYIDDKAVNSNDFFNYVPKGWGYEKWIVNNEMYCGSLLFLEKGKRCS